MGKADNAETIKEVLVRFLRTRALSQFDVVIEELTLGKKYGRIDTVLMHNNEMYGYEIKSDLDSLDRLEKQIEMYGEVMDFMTIVVGRKHMPDVRDLVPKWWGLFLYHNGHIRVLREPENNKNTSDAAVASLLWKETLLDYLYRIDVYKGIDLKKRTKLALQRYILEGIPPHYLKALAVHQLRKHGRRKEHE